MTKKKTSIARQMVINKEFEHGDKIQGISYAERPSNLLEAWQFHLKKYWYHKEDETITNAIVKALCDYLKENEEGSLDSQSAGEIYQLIKDRLDPNVSVTERRVLDVTRMQFYINYMQPGRHDRLRAKFGKLIDSASRDGKINDQIQVLKQGFEQILEKTDDQMKNSGVCLVYYPDFLRSIDKKDKK